MLAGRPEGGAVDAHGIQSYYAGLVARASAMEIEVIEEEGAVTLKATPRPVAPCIPSSLFTASQMCIRRA